MKPTPASPSPHLVWLSAVTWDFPLRGRTRLLFEALVELGVPATFVQIPSLRTALQRLRRSPCPDAVIRPWPIPRPKAWWPPHGSAGLEASARRQAARLRRDLLRRVDPARAVALAVSPSWAPWIETLGFAHVVYDCIDHVDVMTPRPELRPLYRAWEERLIAASSAVTFTCDALARSHAHGLGERPAMIVPNGVDAPGFERAAATQPRPADLPPVGARPLVGFVGALYEWVDHGLIARVAERLPDHDFVFVGPRRGMPPLPDRPNVHVLGHRDHGLVPAYIEAFDVGWVPFRDDAVSRAADPVKIYEYLALGKPVVTSRGVPIASFEGLVRSGDGAEEIAGLLAAACGEDRPGAEARRRFAAEHTWRARALQLLELVSTLGDDRGRPCSADTRSGTR